MVVILASSPNGVIVTEKLIEPDNYTPEIRASILKIKSRMKNTLVSFTEQDIKVFENEGMAYILANPVLGQEPLYDEMGNFQEMIPMYNLTVIYDRDWIQTEVKDNQLIFTAKVPRLRILRPDLCDRINL